LFFVNERRPPKERLANDKGNSKSRAEVNTSISWAELFLKISSESFIKYPLLRKVL
jgi:hypothetical protein